MARKKFDRSLLPDFPNLKYEKKIWKTGQLLIAGIDEAGRGCLAGPVYAGVVILEKNPKLTKILKGVRDSKEMNAKNRKHFQELIFKTALSCQVGYASAKEIDSIGIVPATRLAMQRAINLLSVLPQHLLIDYVTLPEIELPASSLVKGDARSLSIASASILAKVARDEHMIIMAKKYPGYQFEKNKGYGTKSHRVALKKLGPCKVHRRSFAPLRLEIEQARLL